MSSKDSFEGGYGHSRQLNATIYVQNTNFHVHNPLQDAYKDSRTSTSTCQQQQQLEVTRQFIHENNQLLALIRETQTSLVCDKCQEEDTSRNGASVASKSTCRP